ncbi:hypothetical protein ABE29_18255 [Cytobacillus firmus]|jgi:hypothetical protein|uniref:hypothetical protein n=1 Tax=Cytobacillus firmus TaxID=1399 RepID=UPI0018CCCB87|nr:hypothetical protein [Cytobacillus firmus]MBG9544643.1 hypothetical protein [Cytobacillus firmus]MBG9553637.1 hypothetical protein [Cytobacillus firmus]MBG9577067.1 hypothetical protein [Cytobacillus firmus]MED4448803.1 hypothetical protein [Cytobacillus firmus]MED4769334.1 hypothetical protein [Cytobacillus firmus]
MTRDMVQMLQGNVDAVRGMELLLQQKRELKEAGYQENEMYLLPGMLVLQLEDGEVRWMVFEGEFKMEIWKN